MRSFKLLGSATLSALLLMAAGTAQAASEWYTYEITGDVLFDGGSVWGLTTGDVVTAQVTFFDDLGGTETVSGAVISNLTLDLNGTILTTADMDGDVLLSLDNGSLTDFSFFTTAFDFNSSFTFFDDGVGSQLVGEWRGDVTGSVVPVPAAVWLFGSGLVALAGWRRRQTAA